MREVRGREEERTRQRKGEEVGEEVVEDEDEDDQEETRLGERQGVKKVRAREGWRDTLKEKGRGRGRGRMRSGLRVGDVQYCSNDAEAAPLATIFSLYLLGIHLVLYSGLLHFIPALLPYPLSVSHFLSLLVPLRRIALSRRSRGRHTGTGTRRRKAFFAFPPNSSGLNADQKRSFFFQK